MADEQQKRLGGDDAAGDRIGGDKITAGDIQATNVAIGRGAQLIVNQIQRSLSNVEELEKSIQTAERYLAIAISEKVTRYTSFDAEQRDASAGSRNNPYKSLLDYKLEDAPYFFGRREATGAMLERIQQRRLTVLHSDSGSGKTSLLQAGLASHLLAEGHFPLYLRPYRHPPGQFIKRAFLPDYATRPELAHFADDKMSLKGFLERATSYLGERRLYIFLDQFEELFTELDPPTQRTFATQLQDCVQSDLPVWWVLALRKEYFSDLRLFRSLRPFDNEYFLQTFKLEEAQEVVTEPAALRNVEYEPGLVAKLLADIRLEAEAIPPAQVQLVCYTLFEELAQEADPTVITHALYEKRRGRSGGRGAAGILTSHMTRVLDRELSGRERQAAAPVLEALVTSDMRRVLRTEAQLIDDLPTVDPAVLNNVLEALYENRLVRRELDEHDQPLYELTHDYLLSEIELDPETKARKAAQEMLDREVIAWQNNPALRIPADRLDMITAHLDQLALSDDAAELLELSRKALRRRRQLTIAGGSVVLILVIAAIVSVVTAVGAQQLAHAAENTLATATVQLAAAEVKLGAALDEQQQAVAQQATTEAATILAEQQVGDLEQKGAALNLALRSLGSADPEAALFLAVEAAQRGGGNTPLQVQQAFWHSLSSGLRHVLEGHEGAVIHASFSHNGRYLASVGADDTIRIWDVQSGDQRYLFDSEGGALTSYAFSNDDALLAAGNEGGSIQVWDLDTGQQRHKLMGHTGPILSVIFGPDDDYLASGGSDNSIRTWDVMSGEQLDEFCEALCSEEDFGGAVSHIVFSPDGRYSASHALSAELLVRTLPSGEERVLSYGSDLGHTFDVYDLTFSADSRLIAAEGNFAAVWNVQTFLPETFLADDVGTSFRPSDQYFISALQAQSAADRLSLAVPLSPQGGAFGNRFHPQGEYYATVASDDTVHIWNAESSEEINILRGHGGRVTSAVFSPDGRFLASASEEGTVRIWEDVLLANKGPKVYEFAASPDTHIETTGISFSADGRFLAGGRDLVAVWELASGQQQHVLLEDAPLYSSFARLRLNHDGTILLAATPHTHTFQQLVVWEVSSGVEICRMEGHETSGLSPDGRYFALVSAENQITVFETAACREMQTLNRPMSAEAPAEDSPQTSLERVSFSADDRYLAALDTAEQTVHVWELKSGDQLTTLPDAVEFNDLDSEISFDPGGRYLASSNFAEIRIWDIASGEITLVSGDNDHRLRDFEFSPDGQTMVAGYFDGLVRLWDVASGEELREMRGHTTPIDGVAYSADGRFLASTDSETVRIWDAETGDELYSFELLLLDGLPQSFVGDHDIEFSPLGDYLALVAENGLIHVYYFDAVEPMLASATERIGPTLRAALNP